MPAAPQIVAVLLVYLPTCLGCGLRSGCHLLLAVEPLKGRGNPIKCLAQGHNGRNYRPIFTLSLF